MVPNEDSKLKMAADGENEADYKSAIHEHHFSNKSFWKCQLFLDTLYPRNPRMCLIEIKKERAVYGAMFCPAGFEFFFAVPPCPKHVKTHFSSGTHTYLQSCIHQTRFFIHTASLRGKQEWFDTINVC